MARGERKKDKMAGMMSSIGQLYQLFGPEARSKQNLLDLEAEKMGFENEQLRRGADTVLAKKAAELAGIESANRRMGLENERFAAITPETITEAQDVNRFRAEEHVPRMQALRTGAAAGEAALLREKTMLPLDVKRAETGSGIDQNQLDFALRSLEDRLQLQNLNAKTAGVAYDEAQVRNAFNKRVSDLLYNKQDLENQQLQAGLTRERETLPVDIQRAKYGLETDKSQADFAKLSLKDRLELERLKAAAGNVDLNDAIVKSELNERISELLYGKQELENKKLAGEVALQENMLKANAPKDPADLFKQLQAGRPAGERVDPRFISSSLSNEAQAAQQWENVKNSIFSKIPPEEITNAKVPTLTKVFMGGGTDRGTKAVRALQLLHKYNLTPYGNSFSQANDPTGPNRRNNLFVLMELLRQADKAKSGGDAGAEATIQKLKQLNNIKE